MDTQRTIQLQRRFFQSEVTRSLDFRIEQLKRLKRAIELYEKRIIDALYRDLNKSEMEAYVTEVGMVYSEISTAIRSLAGWVRPVKVKTPISHRPGKSYIVSDPHGVTFIIAPWNYPFQLAMMPLVGAIAGGNTAVIKPSEYATFTSQVLYDLVKETFDPGFVTVVIGGVEESTALLKERFDYIFFTGSPEVGRIVMEAASRHLTPVTLELGGKSPAIVMADSDIDLAAKRIAFGKLVNAGQTCVAPDYVYVEQKVKDELIDRLKYYIEEFYGQDPVHNDHYPRIINEKHYERLIGYLQDKNYVYGGNRVKKNLKIAPTIIEGVEEEDLLMQEEIFGPILPVNTFEWVDEVIYRVNKREKPLALYLFTKDKDVEHEITSRVNFGGGCINDTLMHVAHPNLPFGGAGTSGMGNYHGKASFDAFTHKKSIYKKGRGDIPFRYPPFTSSKLFWIRRFLK